MTSMLEGDPTAVPVAIDGSDPAVLFLHGQPGGPEIWSSAQGELSSLGYDAVAVDRPGYGAATLEAGGFAHNADFLGELIEANGAPAVVVAHSWAAGAAIVLARRAPHLVTGLVLCAPVGDRRSIGLLDRFLARGRTGGLVLRGALVLGGWLVRFPGGEHLLPVGGLGHLGPVDARSATSPALDRRARRAAAVEQRALVAELGEVRRAARHLTVPTIVIAGRRDGIVRLGAVAGLARAIPRAQLRIVEGGHLLPAEHPAAVVDAVTSLVPAPRSS